MSIQKFHGINAANLSGTRAVGARFDPPAGWLQVVDKVIRIGKFDPGYDDVPPSYTLVNVQGDASNSHLEESITVNGYFNEAGAFVPGTVVVLSDDWTVDAAGDWHLDQWAHQLWFDGEPTLCVRNHLVKHPNGMVIDCDSEYLDVNSSEATKNREALTQKWLEFEPPQFSPKMQRPKIQLW